MPTEPIRQFFLDTREHILVYPDFLPKEICKQLFDYATDEQRGTNKGTIGKNEVNPLVRDVDIIKPDNSHFFLLNIFVQTYCKTLSKHYNVKFLDFERPGILRYATGGKYQLHSDAHHWDPKKKDMVQQFDRDYSVLIYLNEDFEGGQLQFPYQNLKVTPKTGLLVAFPSDYLFQHAAMPVTKGIRACMVSWGRAIQDKRPDVIDPPKDEILVNVEQTEVGKLNAQWQDILNV